VLRPATEEEALEKILELTRESSHVEVIELDKVITTDCARKQPKTTEDDLQDESVKEQVQVSEHVGGLTPQATPEQHTNDVEISAENTETGVEKGVEKGAEKAQSAHLFDGGHRQECAICFDDLHERPVAVLLSAQNRRCCRHYFHQSCLGELVAASIRNCPLCRVSFCHVQPLPDIRRQPREWFKLVDFSGTMRLSRDEVLDALGAVLPVDVTLLEEALQNELWSRWDPRIEGICLEDFEDSSSGLLQWVLYKLPSAKLERASCPDLLAGKEAWFRYWDDDGKHALSQQALRRSLAKTFRLQVDDIDLLGEVLQEVWEEFGLGERSASRSLFCEPGSGLADTVIDGLKKRWGQDGFRRRHQRGQLCQMSIRELKEQLKQKRGGEKALLSCIEKDDLVKAILDGDQPEVWPTTECGDEDHASQPPAKKTCCCNLM